MRPDFDTYGLHFARTASLRGDCIRKKVGAALFDSENRLVSTGYNGTAPGGPSCLAGDCARCLDPTIPSGTRYDECIERHAEDNCLDWWDGWGKAPFRMYTNYAPCNGCQLLLVDRDVMKVWWVDDYLIPKNNGWSIPSYLIHYRDLSLPKM